MAGKTQTTIVLAVLGAILAIATTALAYVLKVNGTAHVADTRSQVNAFRIDEIKADWSDITMEQRTIRAEQQTIRIEQTKISGKLDLLLERGPYGETARNPD